MDSKKLIALIVCVTVLPAAELPVRTVVLYKHGVGYFERAGRGSRRGSISMPAR